MSSIGASRSYLGKHKARVMGDVPGASALDVHFRPSRDGLPKVSEFRDVGCFVME